LVRIPWWKVVVSGVAVSLYVEELWWRMALEEL